MKPIFLRPTASSCSVFASGIKRGPVQANMWICTCYKILQPSPTVTTSSTVSEASILVALDIGIKFCCIVKRGKDTKIVVVKIAELYFMSHLLAVEYKCKWIKITGKVYSLSCSVFNLLNAQTLILLPDKRSLQHAGTEMSLAQHFFILANLCYGLSLILFSTKRT